MAKLKDLQDKRDTFAATIKTFADKANDKAQEWSSEDQTNYEKANADYDANLTELEAEDKRQKVVERSANIAAAIAADRKELRKIGRDDFRSRSGGELSADAECTDKHRALALQAWLRIQKRMGITEAHQEACERAGLDPYSEALEFRICSRAPRSLWECRDLSAIDATLGGYTVPMGMLQPLESALLTFGGMRQAADVIRTDSGSVLPFPTSDDTSNSGELLGENTEVGEQNTTFGAVNLEAYKYSSKLIQVPIELLQDSAVNLPAFLGERMGERIARIQNLHFTTGNGASKPSGIITGATAGNTAASATAITMDEVLDLLATVDPAYRPGSVFMCRDATVIKLRKLKDLQGQYLWSKGDVTTNEPDRLWGYPVIVNQDVAAVTNSAKVLLFGQFSRYKIRDVQTIRVLQARERWIEFDQVGFIAFMRSDGALIDAGTHPVKYLTMLA